MSLKLYIDAQTDSYITSLNPFRVTFDGHLGGAIDTKLYLRNDDPRLWYSDIQIQAVDLGSGNDRTDGTEPGFWFKLATKDTEVLLEEWQEIDKGNILILSDLGSSSGADIVTYRSVWVRVVIPADTALKTVKDITLRISAREHLV